MTNALTNIPLNQLLHEAQERGVIVRESAAVRNYLVRHPNAQSIILPAIDVTRRLVGSEPQLSLELYRDPEIGSEQLSLYVRSNMYSSSFLRDLRAADEVVRALRADKDNRFLVTSDIQPPK
jgi:hypothetical protein